jgi:hypothetical protein
MSPLSPVVLVAAAVVSSPALWGGLVEQTTPMSVALTRYLLCIVLCWAALGLVVTLVGPPPRPEREAQGASTEDPGTGERAESTESSARETAGSEAR